MIHLGVTEMTERDRAAELDRTSEMVAVTMAIFSIPRDVPTEAFVLVPGLIGEEHRIIYAINRWQSSFLDGVEYLLIPGHTEDNPIILTVENLQQPPFNLRRLDGVHCNHISQHQDPG